MFNSFPQPKPDSGGGLPSPFDWSAYQTVYDLMGTTQSVPANNWGTFVDITGKGYFKWCRVGDLNNASFNPNIRLTIDGRVYQFDGVAAGASRQGNEINFEIPFKTSLKIEAFNGHASAIATFVCDYLYFLQTATPKSSLNTLLSQSSRKMAYASGGGTTLTDTLNVTGSGYLLGVRFLGYYQTASAAIYGDISIDGVQKMTDRLCYQIGTEGDKQPDVVGPIRFNASLRVRTRVNVTGSSYVCVAEYSLD